MSAKFGKHTHIVNPQPPISRKTGMPKPLIIYERHKNANEHRVRCRVRINPSPNIVRSPAYIRPGISTPNNPMPLCNTWPTALLSCKRNARASGESALNTDRSCQKRW